MQGQLTYRLAKKLNAVFLLLLFSAEQPSAAPESTHETPQRETAGQAKSQDYFDEKMKEFERNKFRF